MNQVKYVLVVVLFFAVKANGQNWLWASAPKSTPGSATPNAVYISNWLLTTGTDNSLYNVISNYGSILSIGPYVFYDTALYYNSPMSQTVVVKYDLSGNVVWAVASGYGSTIPLSIMPDDSGNVYVYGLANTDTVVFGPYTASIPYNTVEPSDLFYLVKITAEGNIAWLQSGAMSYRGVGWSDLVRGGIALDKGSNVYLASSTDTGILLSKFDPAGNKLWSKRYPADIEAEVTGMAFYNNRLYITGNFQSSQLILGTDTFTYTGPAYNPGLSVTNCYMACIDTAGSVVWASCSHSLATTNDLKIDSSGNIYVCGNVIVGPYMVWGDDSVVIPTEGQAGFFASADTNGHTRWLQVFPQKIPDYSALTANNVDNIAIDPCGHIWLSGSIDTPAGIVLDTTVLFGPPGSTDPMFIAAFTDSGKLLHAFTLPSGGYQNNALAADTFGNIYLAGSFSFKDPFVIGHDSLYTYNAGSSNAFVAKFNPAVSAVTNSPAAICPGGSTILRAPAGYAKYFWNTDSVSTSLAVGSVGTFTVYCYQGCDLVETQVSKVDEIMLHSFAEDTGTCYMAGDAILLDPAAPGNATVAWSTGQGAPTISVTETGSYTATISEDGCSVTDTFNVDVYDCSCVVSLPDAFTPNGDGRNDAFGVADQTCTFLQFSFSVYDRWGKLIFKTNDPHHYWDGSYEHRLQDIDVYMYYVDYKTDRDHRTRHLKGTVTLIR